MHRWQCQIQGDVPESEVAQVSPIQPRATTLARYCAESELPYGERVRRYL